MKLLAIETSCDETAVALLECTGSVEAPSIKALSQALYSQVKEHAPFGGVFPALAKREHVKNIVPLFLECVGRQLKGGNFLEVGGKKLEDIKEILKHERGLFEQFEEHIVPLARPHIDAIAVTCGPGLEPALWVGVNFVKALSYLWDMPIVPTNHMEGHIASVLLDGGNPKKIEYPTIALLASGGHTELVLVDKPLSYRRIGQTRDDAVGEAFDKVARLLGLPYPGGPQISKLAESVRARPEPRHNTGITFPRPMLHSDDFDFSYAGLKTAVLYTIQELGDLNDQLKEAIAYEFEESATDVLISKTKKALETHGAQTLIVGGGVIANNYLRERLSTLANESGVVLLLPTRDLSTDNAIMIGAAAYLHLANGETFTPYTLGDTAVEANGTLRL